MPTHSVGPIRQAKNEVYLLEPAPTPPSLVEQVTGWTGEFALYFTVTVLGSLCAYGIKTGLAKTLTWLFGYR